MADYIEREALRQEIARIYQKHFAKSREKFVQDTFKAMFKRIDNAPAADVAPVVHGRWELHGNYDDIGASYFCTKCGYNMDEGEYLDNWSHFRYCPNCGAKMDGDT